MKTKMLIALIVAGILMGVVAYAQQEAPTVANMPPVVVSTVPQSGDTKVDPSVTEIRVTFSKDMQDKSWSWTTMSEGTFPELIGKPHYESDQRTCVIKVKLEPGRTYGTWLNSQRFGNFKDTNEKSAVPYLLIFETGAK